MEYCMKVSFLLVSVYKIWFLQNVVPYYEKNFYVISILMCINNMPYCYSKSYLCHVFFFKFTITKTLDGNVVAKRLKRNSRLIFSNVEH